MKNVIEATRELIGQTKVSAEKLSEKEKESFLKSINVIDSINDNLSILNEQGLHQTSQFLSLIIFTRLTEDQAAYNAIVEASYKAASNYSLPKLKNINRG